jgi:hypothetical protein
VLFYIWSTNLVLKHELTEIENFEEPFRGLILVNH